MASQLGRLLDALTVPGDSDFADTIGEAVVQHLPDDEASVDLVAQRAAALTIRVLRSAGYIDRPIAPELIEDLSTQLAEQGES